MISTLSAPASPRSDSPRSRTDFSSFLDTYREKLKQVFHVRADIDKLSLTRGLPPFVMREIRSCSPLSVFIPAEYGGRGGHVHECQAILEASSYESLALSLTVGINGALFLQPVAKYGCDSVKPRIFERFLEQKTMGGLMITEPDYGTDALNMQTAYLDEEDHYHIRGLKHWAGLTGWADFWLVTARREDDGQLGRDIDFFICDVSDPAQVIEVEEYFENLGLYMIPYGRNRIDARVPREQRLVPETTGIKMMLDLLHRSRIQFPGMGMGFLRRILDETVEHCRERYVGGSSLFSYDQVRRRLAKIQASFTTCSAMCTYASAHAGLENDLSKESVAANATKSVITDLMQDAAQSFLQLVGAKGYRLDHLAGRATVDSRPFQIFEGSNDVLYQQISESVLKAMRRLKEPNLYEYLKGYDLTERAADYFKNVLSFELDPKMPQRKLVDLGRALGRIISMDYVLQLGERGFNRDLITNCLAEMSEEISALLTSYRHDQLSAVVEDYDVDSSWRDYLMTS